MSDTRRRLPVDPQRMRRKLRDLVEKANRSQDSAVRATVIQVARAIDRKHVAPVTPTYRIRGG